MGITRNGVNVYPALEISCAHPVLVKQLRQIAKSHNIHLTIKHSKSHWSGYRGLTSCSIKNLINFIKFGGFIKCVKISLHSPYYEGTDKDVLTLGILEFINRSSENPLLRKLSLKNAHYEIKKIIKNREYKSADYYINLLS